MGKGCFHCMRVLVILFNLLFVLAGGSIVCSVIYLELAKPPIYKEQPRGLIAACFCLYACLTFAGLLGAVTAKCRRVCLLGLHLLPLVVAYAGHLALVVTLLVNADSVKEKIGNSVTQLQQSYVGSDSDSVQLMDFLQKNLHCCGSQSYKDYTDAERNQRIPWSCCDIRVPSPRRCRPDTHWMSYQLAFKQGCRDATERLVWRHARTALLISLGLSAAQLICIALSLAICCLHRRPSIYSPGAVRSNVGRRETVV